jgi:hypothetical protein
MVLKSGVVVAVVRVIVVNGGGCSGGFQWSYWFGVMIGG